jgi:hypothetical protein
VTAPQLSVGLIFTGSVALVATSHLGSPWPGVVLIGLSLVPWGWDEVAGRIKGSDNERFGRVDSAIRELQDSARETKTRLEEHGQQISSLRSTVNMRGIMGG